MRSRSVRLSAAVSAFALTAGVFGFLEIGHLIANGRMQPGPVCRVEVTRPVVALSFDDGPNNRFTRSFLRVLRRHGATATFFLVGQRAIAYPGLVIAEKRAGMGVGNHTWDHPDLPKLTVAQQRQEILRTSHALQQIAGRAPELFRAPFGEMTSAALRIASSLHLRTVGWALAVEHYLDGLGMSPREAADALSRVVQPGDIILAHDGGALRSSTLQALSPLLTRLGARGFEVVSVEELLDAGRAVAAVPRPWFWQQGFTCPHGR